MPASVFSRNERNSPHRPVTCIAQTFCGRQASDSERLSLIKHHLALTCKVWAHEEGHRETSRGPKWLMSVRDGHVDAGESHRRRTACSEVKTQGRPAGRVRSPARARPWAATGSKH